jgi:hypothetical protein
MSILDVVALYQAREIMLRWFDSTPKVPERSCASGHGRPEILEESECRYSSDMDRTI